MKASGVVEKSPQTSASNRRIFKEYSTFSREFGFERKNDSQKSIPIET
jgi:hypothetical protein